MNLGGLQRQGRLAFRAMRNGRQKHRGNPNQRTPLWGFTEPTSRSIQQFRFVKTHTGTLRVSAWAFLLTPCLGATHPSLNLQQLAFRMAVEFGSIHALDLGEPGLVFTGMLHAYGVFEHIVALGQVVNEVMGCRVAGRLVVD